MSKVAPQTSFSSSVIAVKFFFFLAQKFHVIDQAWAWALKEGATWYNKNIFLMNLVTSPLIDTVPVPEKRL